MSKDDTAQEERVRPEYPHRDGPVIVIGPECIAAEDQSVIAWKGENYRREDDVRRVITEVVGYLSAELAGRADAWNGNAPEWFPEPPEWLTLKDEALSKIDPASPHA